MKQVIMQWGCVLGHQKNKVFHAIYYARKTLNEAQTNYSTTKKDFLAIVFSLDKLWPYLIGNKFIVFTDHSTITYLMTKKVAKALPQKMDYFFSSRI